MADRQHHASFEVYSAVTTDGLNRPVSMVVYEPEQPTTQTPTVIANGWGTGAATMSRPARHLAGEGVPVVTFDHHRTNDGNPTARKVDMLAAVASAAADIFGSERVRLRAYSEGLIHAARVAAQASGLVQMVDAVSGFGLVPTSIEGLARRACDEVARLRKPNAALAQAAFFGLRYVSGEPRLTIREICSVAGEDALPDIAAALRSRVPFSFVYLRQDRISPQAASARRLDANNLPVTVLTRDGGHFDFLFSTDISAALNSAPVTNPVRRGRPRKKWVMPEAA